MKRRLVFIVVTMLLFLSTGTFAQQGADGSPADTAFWVAYWGQPRVILFGPEQQAFNSNLQEILFPWNESNDPSNPGALDSNIEWLKNHPGARFYIEGYASSRGDLVYNLVLSQKRAEWVRQVLLNKGIPENRIVMAVGWGQLYPVCPELNDECWSKNRRVRFAYSPN